MGFFFGNYFCMNQLWCYGIMFSLQLELAMRDENMNPKERAHMKLEEKNS